MPRDDFFNQLLTYWRQLQAASGRPVPARQQFNPMAVPRLLPFIYIIERKSRYQLVARLTGTALDGATSQPATNTNILDRHDKSEWDLHADMFEGLANTPCGVVLDRHMQILSDPLYRVRALGLPLADSDGQVRFSVGIANVQPVYGPPDEVDMADIRLSWLDLGFGVPETRPALVRGAASPIEN
ncbi:MAG: PAS domain-containing protein [Alphaproteobacteria bacterium]|nr:MAG: PAS domain-containing protein [Alphaproteobacteria bacterium]